MFGIVGPLMGKYVLKNCLAPWQGTFATPGMGMGGEIETNICCIHHPIYDLYWCLNYLLMIFLSFYENHQENTKNVFCLICSANWQGFFVTPGMGMGGGEIGTNVCSIHHPIYDFYRCLMIYI